MLLLMEMAGKTVVVERDKNLIHNVFLPEYRWTVYVPRDRRSYFTSEEAYFTSEEAYFTGFTKRQAVCKAFQKVMVDDAEEKA